MKMPYMHSYFEASAKRHPSLDAVDVPPPVGLPETARIKLTYSELDDISTRLAGSLAAKVSQRAARFAVYTGNPASTQRQPARFDVL